jgi:Na+(H+)/acetate symporter ActP
VGIGHTLPYLIPNFFTATAVAVVVVVLELLTIAWIQWKYMETPPVSAAAKVMLGAGWSSRPAFSLEMLEAEEASWLETRCIPLR